MTDTRVTFHLSPHDIFTKVDPDERLDLSGENATDVEKAIALGAEGVLLASAFVNSKEPERFLADLVSKV